MKNKLNEEQIKLVENHHYIIYMCLKTLKLSVDEYYDLAAIGLCEAAFNFDRSKNIKFSTFSMNCIKKTIYKEFRKKNCKKRKADIIHFEHLSNNEELVCRYGSVDIETEAIYNIVCKEFMDYIRTKPEIYLIVLLSYYGYTQKQISSIMNISQSKVFLIKKELKNYISERL